MFRTLLVLFVALLITACEQPVAGQVTPETSPNIMINTEARTAVIPPGEYVTVQRFTNTYKSCKIGNAPSLCLVTAYHEKWKIVNTNEGRLLITQVNGAQVNEHTIDLSPGVRTAVIPDKIWATLTEGNPVTVEWAAIVTVRQ